MQQLLTICAGMSCRRRKLSAYASIALEEQEAEHASRRAAPQQAAFAADAAAAPSAEPINNATFVNPTLYDADGQRRSSRFQEVTPMLAMLTDAAPIS